MGAYHPDPKPTTRQKDDLRFGGIMREYPESVELIERLAKTLLDRPLAERKRRGGKKVTAEQNELGVATLKKLATNLSDLNIVERRFGVKISVNGSVMVATCCKETKCPHTHCTNRC